MGGRVIQCMMGGERGTLPGQRLQKMPVSRTVLPTPGLPPASPPHPPEGGPLTWPSFLRFASCIPPLRSVVGGRQGLTCVTAPTSALPCTYVAVQQPLNAGHQLGLHLGGQHLCALHAHACHLASVLPSSAAVGSCQWTRPRYVCLPCSVQELGTAWWNDKEYAIRLCGSETLLLARLLPQYGNSARSAVGWMKTHTPELSCKLAKVKCCAGSCASHSNYIYPSKPTCVRTRSLHCSQPGLRVCGN